MSLPEFYESPYGQTKPDVVKYEDKVYNGIPTKREGKRNQAKNCKEDQKK